MGQPPERRPKIELLAGNTAIDEGHPRTRYAILQITGAESPSHANLLAQDYATDTLGLQRSDLVVTLVCVTPFSYPGELLIYSATVVEGVRQEPHPIDWSSGAAA